MYIFCGQTKSTGNIVVNKLLRMELSPETRVAICIKNVCKYTCTYRFLFLQRQIVNKHNEGTKALLHSLGI